MRTFILVMFWTHILGGGIAIWAADRAHERSRIGSMWYNFFLALGYMAMAIWAGFLLWPTK